MSLVAQGLSFRAAVPDDLTGLVQLINSAYRGDSSRAGWTTEADLLSGVRTDVAELSQIINTEGSVLLLCIRSGEIIGSVHVQRIDEDADLVEQLSRDIIVLNKDLNLNTTVGKDLLLRLAHAGSSLAP